jgi:hypothetical protein
VRQDNHVVIRSISYEKKKGYIKRMQVLGLEQIEGVWVTTRMKVTRKRGKQLVHQTLLTFNNVRFNQEMDEELFTLRRLEKGL